MSNVTVTDNGSTITINVSEPLVNVGVPGLAAHNTLTGRSAADAHPTSAISGLDAALAAKVGGAAALLTPGKILATNAAGSAREATVAEVIAGLGLTALAAGALLFASGPSTLDKLPLGAAGRLLVAGPTAPEWSNKLAVGSITGLLTIAKAGTTARTATVPDADTTVAGINLAQTFTQPQTITTGTTTQLNVTRAGESQIALTCTNTSSGAALIAGAGDGTTSSRFAYSSFGSLETSPQTWRAGLWGSKSFTIRDEQAAENVLQIANGAGGAITLARPVTVTGSNVFTVGDGTGTATYAQINGASGASSAQLVYQVNSISRWILRTFGAVSSGDAGAGFEICARTDTGAFIDNPLQIVRAAGGALTISRPTTINAALTIGSTAITRPETTGQPTFDTRTNSSGDSLALKYTEVAAGSIPADVWQYRLGGGAARPFYFTNYDTNVAFGILPSGELVGAGGFRVQPSAGYMFAQQMVIGDGTSNAGLVIHSNGPGNSNGGIAFARNTLSAAGLRWLFFNSNAESTGNAGSNLILQAFSDSGALIDTPLTITRAANGTIAWGRPVMALGTNAATTTQFILNAGAGVDREFVVQSAGVSRWRIRVDSSAESGSNAGSGFVLRAFDDAGAAIDSPISVARAAGGAITLARPVLINAGPFTYDGTTLGVSRIIALSGAANNARIEISSNAGLEKGFYFKTGSNLRWTFGFSANAESGGNAGADCTLAAFTDAGAAIDTPLTIIRAAGGAITLARPVSLSSSLTTGTTAAIGTGLSVGPSATAPAAGGIYLSRGTASAFLAFQTNGVGEAQLRVTAANVLSITDQSGSTPYLSVNTSTGVVSALGTNLRLVNSQNGQNSIVCDNQHAGASARADMQSAVNGASIQMTQFGPGHANANQGWIYTAGASNVLVFGTVGAERMRIGATGVVTVQGTADGILTVNGKITAKAAVPASFADLAAVRTYLASILT